MRALIAAAFGAAVAAAPACAADDRGEASSGGETCPIGAETCPCSMFGECQAGLRCLSGTCVFDPGGGTTTTGGGTSSGSTASGGSAGTSSSGASGSSTSAGVTSDDPTGSTSGFKLDVAGTSDTTGGPLSGCRKIDVVFALDGSPSMADDRQALAASSAFSQVIATLEGLNGGGIDYRIGVTNDADQGWVTPAGWMPGAPPWFDSSALTPTEIALAFSGAASSIGQPPGFGAGCEHVLTSAVDLLIGDTSGFVRDDALLLLVLVTDVDDYGLYDRPEGNTCGLGCTQPYRSVADLTSGLTVLVKRNVPDSVAAIAVAGDPNSNAGLNFCGQPGSCGCTALGDCAAFHATRISEFVAGLGDAGYFGDICGGAASVPAAVRTGLEERIDLACQEFVPPG